MVDLTSLTVRGLIVFTIMACTSIRELNGAYVLRLVRDGVCKNWSDLYRHFFGGDQTSEVLVLAGLVAKLFRDEFLAYATLPGAGFEIMDAMLWMSDAEAFTDRDRPLRVTDRCYHLRETLGVGLTMLASLDRKSHLVRPFFGAPDKIKKQPDVFVVMPFAPELKLIYDDHIVPVVNQLGRKASRGDDFFGTGAVMSEIWNAICASQIVIADCTGRNPNVFYEIGVAHTVGKPVILLTQIVEDVPFDLRHIRFIKYELTRRGIQKFEEDLLATLRDEIG